MPVDTTIAGELEWSEAALAEGREAAQWRVWRYRAPEIVLGCSQRAFHPAVRERAPAGIDVVVRRSGGGAVFAGPWLVGATVVLPPGHRLLGTGLVDSYRWFGRLHERLLREAGVPARALDPSRDPGDAAQPVVRWACFGSLSPWEVVDPDGRKLVGLAQRRRRTGVAYSAGTLVTRPPWEILCDAFGAPGDRALLDAATAACNEAAAARALDADAWALRLEVALAATLGAPRFVQSRSVASESRTASGSGSACAE